MPCLFGDYGTTGLKHIIDMFVHCSSNDVVRKLGFVIMAGDLPILMTDQIQKQLISEESEYFKKWFGFQCALAGCQLRRVLWHQEGLPGVLPQLTQDSPVKVNRTLDWLKELRRVHRAAKDHVDLPHVKAQLEMSFLNNPIPKQVMEALDEHGFREVPDDILDAIVSLFGLGATVACEQANRASRNAAEREADHCKLSSQRIMLLPYRNKVLSKMNEYDEIQHTEYTASMARESAGTKLDAAFFTPGSHKPMLPLRAVSNTKQTADFFTCTPFASAKVYAFHQYWRHCCRVPADWEKGERLWQCQLMYRGELVRSRANSRRHLFKPFCFFEGIMSQVSDLHFEIDRTRICVLIWDLS
jgi:hypothetical protein